MSKRDAPIGSMVAGCLLGGAIGEALGRRIEQRSPTEAEPIHGAGDSAENVAIEGQAGTIGWHTQLTIVTAEGLLRASNRVRARGFGDVRAVIYQAYRRWLAAQGQLAPIDSLEEPMSSWLLSLPALADQRGVSETTVAALRSGVQGTPGRPINDSQGCGAITHIAPVGLAPPEVDVARWAMDVAALTDGHAIAQLAAGVVAVLIHRLMARQTLEDALRDAVSWLRWAQSERQDATALAPLVEVLRHIMRSDAGVLETAVRAGEFGSGHTAGEALAIALACVRGAHDVEHGLRLAVNHGGARDATGTLTGQILGTLHGAGSLPERWLAPLEVRDALMELSHDWDRHFFSGGARDHEKYPGF